MVLRGLALPWVDRLLEHLALIEQIAPGRQMRTPGGHTMSVVSSNCGALGWTSDEHGYRYASHDPLSGQPWPAMPAPFLALAHDAAERAGFAHFTPDACLINRYAIGSRMGLHQDRNERDMRAPIVSVSLGLPAEFLFGGFTRSAAVQRVRLLHGDVAVWGGQDRLRYHGIRPLAAGDHPLLGACRVNLTFRLAG